MALLHQCKPHHQTWNKEDLGSDFPRNCQRLWIVHTSGALSGLLKRSTPKEQEGFDQRFLKQGALCMAQREQIEVIQGMTCSKSRPVCWSGKILLPNINSAH